MVTSVFDSSIPCADVNPFVCFSRKPIVHLNYFNTSSGIQHSNEAE